MGSIALALYVIGFSYIAKYENIAGYFLHSSIILIFAPIGLALIVNDEGYRVRCLIVAIGVIIYLIMSIRHLSTQKPADIQKSVSMLIAGIILIDIHALRHLHQPCALSCSFCFFVYSYDYLAKICSRNLIKLSAQVFLFLPLNIFRYTYWV